MASFTVEAFSLDRLRILDYKEIEERFREFKRLTHFEDIRDRLCRLVCTIRFAARMHVVARDRLCCWLGCATSEETRCKSLKGYYQEGMANLDADRQQAFVSFQKAVKLNPDNKEAHYGLGHILRLQGKFHKRKRSFGRPSASIENIPKRILIWGRS